MPDDKCHDTTAKGTVKAKTRAVSWKTVKAKTRAASWKNPSGELNWVSKPASNYTKYSRKNAS